MKKRLNAMRNQRGMASFVIVGVLVILLTLISIGFARLMDRAQNNSLNNQLSTAASYAAQSALKDTSSYVISQLKAGQPAPVSTNCVPSGGLKTSVYDVGNLSGDNTAKYTCILVNPKPTSLSYSSVPASNSQVVKLTSDAAVSAPGSAYISQLTFSWQSAAGTGNNQLPASGTTLYDETTWNKTDKYEPMLRVTLYPADSSNNVSQGSTFFFYPNSSGGATNVNYGSDGILKAVGCGAGQAYVCNVNINKLPSSANYFYARVTPLYVNTDFGIQGQYNTNYNGTTTVAFANTQATVDVTAKDGSAVKRLQAKVDISSYSSGSSSTGISPGQNDIPEDGLQTANALCKRYSFSVNGGAVPTNLSDACTAESPVPPPTSPAIAPQVSLIASPNAITPGSSTVVSWTVSGTQPFACVRTSSPFVPQWDSITDNSASGSSPSITLGAAGTYTFSEKCTNSVGSDTKTALVNVSSLPTCPPGTTGTPPNCPSSGPPAGGTRQTVNVTISSASIHSGSWSVSIGNNGDGAGLQQCDESYNGGWIESYYPNSNPASNPPVYSYSNPNDNWRGNILPPGGTVTITCSAWDGASGSAQAQIQPPPISIQTSVAGAYNFLGSLGVSTCHDNSHSWVLCVSWNASQDDGINHNYGIPGAFGTGSSMKSCDLYFHSDNFGDGRDSFNATNAPTTSGNPLIFHYWNETLGWFSNPGNVSYYVQCQSTEYGNTNNISNKVNLSPTDFCPTTYGTCYDTPTGGGSGGGGSGGGGSCNATVWGGGTYPNCTCTVAGNYPDCLPPCPAGWSGTPPACIPPPPPGGCGLDTDRPYLPDFGIMVYFGYINPC